MRSLKTTRKIISKYKEAVEIDCIEGFLIGEGLTLMMTIIMWENNIRKIRWKVMCWTQTESYQRRRS
jgi:hypothetical protein